MNKIENHTEIRKMLLSRGYLPLPNIDKRCMLKGWPTVIPTVELITTIWSRMRNYRKATGLRIEKPFGVIDSDISIEAINAAVIERWAVYLPDVFDNADVPLLERGTTASCKVAFFVRMEEPFARLATHEFEDEHGKKHKVEIFGGTSPREFGAFGLHDITLGSTYAWKADSPLDVDAARLPALTKAQCKHLIEIAQETMRSMGLKQVERLSEDDDSRDIIYDITDEMEFENGDSVYSLAELKEVLASTDSLRITAGWHDPASDNRDNPRCIARLLPDGALLITDFGEDGKKHMEASRAAPLDQDAIDAAFAALGEMAGEPPKEGDGAAAVAAKLRSQYAYCPTAKLQVMPIDRQGAAMSQTNFMTKMLPHAEARTGPRGGIKMINPAGLWLADRERVTIEGTQMRPDKGRLFTEDGNQWLNTYRPPAHAASGGDAFIGRAWLRQIAPDPVERKYFTQWLAYKLRHPEVPGPAIIMVANNKYGTGRTTFARLVSLIFGEAYVRTVPFHIVSGKSYQSQYNDWAAESLFVVVTETQETQGMSPYRMKHDTYAHLKELVEVHPHRREVIRQGVIARQIWCFVSYLIMTNDFDAVPMPGDDRRFFVLSGGGTRRAVFWEALNRWMQLPANIAAFADWLMTVNLSDYSPYAPPPMTVAKQAMADTGMSDLDRSLAAVMAALKGRSEIFSAKHVFDRLMAMQADDRLLEFPEKWERKVLRNELPKYDVHRVGVPNGMNWQPKMKDGNRYPTFAWTEKLARKWTPLDWAELRTELLKAGPLDSGFGTAGIHLVRDDDEAG